MPDAAAFTTQLFDASPAVRYVAVLHDGALALAQRPDLADASASESDRYEELLVNPTVLELTSRRGNIDCGGTEYVVIRYGNFFQLVHPVRGGHVSVAVAPDADPIAHVALVRAALAEHGFESPP